MNLNLLPDLVTELALKYPDFVDYGLVAQLRQLPLAVRDRPDPCLDPDPPQLLCRGLLVLEVPPQRKRAREYLFELEKQQVLLRHRRVKPGRSAVHLVS